MTAPAAMTGGPSFTVHHHGIPACTSTPISTAPNTTSITARYAMTRAYRLTFPETSRSRPPWIPYSPAIERLSGSKIKKLLTTNSVPLSEEKKGALQVEVLSVAGLLGEAIKRIHQNSSVSSLFV